MYAIILSLVAMILGIFVGTSINIPYGLSKYLAVAILACLDSVFGAYSSSLNKTFNLNVFVSGFFGNSIIAMILVFIGIKLDVDIYLGAVIVFTTRLLNNFTVIRRILLEQKPKTKGRSKVKIEE